MSNSYNPFKELQYSLNQAIDNASQSSERPARLTNYDPCMGKKSVYDRLSSPIYYTGTAHEVFKQSDPFLRKKENIKSRRDELEASNFRVSGQFGKNDSWSAVSLQGSKPAEQNGVFAKLTNPELFTGSQRSKTASGAQTASQAKALAKKELPLTTDLSQLIVRKERYEDAFKPVLRSASFEHVKIQRKDSAKARASGNKQLAGSTASPNAVSSSGRQESQKASRLGSDGENVFSRLCEPSGYTGTRFIKFNEKFDVEADAMNQDLALKKFEGSLRE